MVFERIPYPVIDVAVSIVSAEDYRPETIRSSLQESFRLLGWERDNPFQRLVKPGDQVFIKPNWVAHEYRRSCPCQHDLYCSITHPNLIIEVARMVDQALAGEGRILIGDNPSIDARFDVLMEHAGLEGLKDELSVPIEILDLRPVYCDDLEHYGKKNKMVDLPGDPRGETVVDLGTASNLHGVNPRLFRGVFSDRSETVWAHSGGRHLYSISNSIYESDVYISLPKLKCHHKVGTTLNLKGLVGTQGTKNYLVHWRQGFPAIGGDAYPSLLHLLKSQFQRVKKRGAWDGNDTIWRMVADLHDIFENRPLRCFSVVDGILGGERNGPFCPEPRDSKVLISGESLLETDVVATRLMGFNPARVTYLQHIMQERSLQSEAIELKSNVTDPTGFWDLEHRHLAFVPPTRWDRLLT